MEKMYRRMNGENWEKSSKKGWLSCCIAYLVIGVVIFLKKTLKYEVGLASCEVGEECRRKWAQNNVRQ